MKFRRKAVEVEAQQFDPDLPSKQWPFGVRWEPEFTDQDGSRLGGFYKLVTYGGFQIIRGGDWVVYGVDGNRRVYAREVFETTYEPVEQAEKEST